MTTKRILSILLIISFLFSFVSCEKIEVTSDTDTTKSPASTEVLTSNADIDTADSVTDDETECDTTVADTTGDTEPTDTKEVIEPVNVQPKSVDEIIKSMTLREKICQMLMLSPEKLEKAGSVIYADEHTKESLEKYPVGGIVYNTANMRSASQISALLNTTQSYSEIPLLFTCDEEGGRVGRLMYTVGTTEFGAMLDYEKMGSDTAFSNAKTIASDISGLGFNMDLAPVADVLTNPSNTVIGDRAYSTDPKLAATLVSSAVGGFHAGGVACVLKHFPGHGSTSEDSHYGSAYVHKTLDELRQCDLIPFKAGIDAGADSVMMGHLIITGIDSETPAVFSKAIVTDLLRNELGFEGVIMTDALEMQALSAHYSSANVTLYAVMAGVDMLLCPADVDESISVLTNAVESGTIPISRIDESVRRILTLKQNRGILK